MPELPEVETIVRRYRRRLAGRTITRFRSLWPPNALPSHAAVKRAVAGRMIASLRRRAKYVVFDLDDNSHLLIHLRMSGRFEWAADHTVPPKHARAIFELDGGDALWFVDSRKFGRITHTRDLASATNHLGIEPLSRAFTERKLADLLHERGRQIKPLLLDQSLVVGLGNIYADEALFAAGVHPLTRSQQLSAEDVERLHKAIRETLRTAIRHNGTSIDWIYPSGQMQDYLRVYGRAGEPCLRCGTPIEALRVAQRGTHVCPRCQPNRSGAHIVSNAGVRH
jgi:formamidopyrimidine-DNA glycosylase